MNPPGFLWSTTPVPTKSDPHRVFNLNMCSMYFYMYKNNNFFNVPHCNLINNGNIIYVIYDYYVLDVLCSENNMFFLKFLIYIQVKKEEQQTIFILLNLGDF